MKKIIVACGSGVATSQTVASKIERLLKEKGYSINIDAVDIKSLKQHINSADAYVSIIKTKDEFNIPVFNGISFLTGVGMDQELEKIIDFIKE